MQIECKKLPISMLDLSISCLQNDFVQVFFFSYCIRLIVMSYVHNVFANCLLNDKSSFIWFDWSLSRSPSLSITSNFVSSLLYHSLIRYLHSSCNNYRIKNSTIFIRHMQRVDIVWHNLLESKSAIKLWGMVYFWISFKL